MDKKRYVVTGMPSAGKTSTLEILATRGLIVIPEAARLVIDQGMAEGLSLEQIRGDKLNFQWQIIAQKKKLDQWFDAASVALEDRGWGDILSYVKHYGLAIPFLDQYHFPYQKVFFLEARKLKSDYARIESSIEAMELGRILLDVYRNLGQKIGYAVVAVSGNLRKKEKAEYILANL